MSSASVTPFSLARCRWNGSCSELPPAISAVTVTRLRSRFDSSARSQTSPNRTSSVSCTSLGEKSPKFFLIAEGSLFMSFAPLGCGRLFAVLLVADLFHPNGRLQRCHVDDEVSSFDHVLIVKSPSSGIRNARSFLRIRRAFVLT